MVLVFSHNPYLTKMNCSHSKSLQFSQIFEASNVDNIHSKLRSITLVATKVHMILRRFVVLTWMRDTIELV
jgi:hypothetical protein